MNESKLERMILHDGIVHNPLGGGSYVFETDYVSYLARQIKKDSVRISIGAQPNSSPHFGTLVVFSLAFALSKSLKEFNKTPEVFFEIIDTSPDKTLIINEIEYQISLRSSGKADAFLDEYVDVLENLKNFSGIFFKLRKQKEFNQHSKIPQILKKIIQNQNLVANILDLKNGRLQLRVACPDCGLTDKHGINNKYFDEYVESFCPHHGSYKTNINNESERFEYNTPLRNLIRALVYAEDNNLNKTPFEWLRVTGSDYSGYYQEQLLYRCSSLLGYPVHSLPQIIYAPLIVDWSGAKISKSLYLKQNAYKYLPQFLVNYAEFKKEKGNDGLKILFDEVSNWMKEPFKLFRHYSVYYFMELFKNAE